MQRDLFAVHSPVGNIVQWPGNQANDAWKPGDPMAWKPGDKRLETRRKSLETRRSWTSFQAIEPLETRRSDTENQQLNPEETPGNQGILDRSNRALSSVEPVVNLRDSIEQVNTLPEECRENATELKRWLRGFFGKHHPSHTVPEGPDEIILAKCLAIAPLANLVSVLQTLNRKATRPGDTWAWFVTVFCQRIHRTRDLTQVAAPPAFRQPKKNPSTEGQGDFQRDLLRETGAAVGRL